MKKKVVAFVPLRLNSTRVVGKNTKKLGGQALLTYIFNTLKKVKSIDKIYAFCSSETIKMLLPSGIDFLKRDVFLDGDDIVGLDIYKSFTSLIDADVYLLAHSTSPFLSPQSIEDALLNVIEENYDSAFSAQKIQTFAWFQGKPLNYTFDNVPRTQDIEPIFIETSAFFIFEKFLMAEYGRRIGFNPYMKILNGAEAIDIDNIEDFELAEQFIATLQK